MRYNFILKFFAFILIIFFIFSCDVLTKMNEQEWNEENLDEDKEDMFFIYCTGYCDIGTGNLNDFTTIKFDEMGRDHWLRIQPIPTNDQALGITLDSYGDVYVCGNLNNVGNYFILKYDFTGAPSFNYNSAGGTFNGVTSDSSNNIYTTGTNWTQFNTYKFNSNLGYISNNVFSPGTADVANGITYNNNNIYVVGDSDLGADIDIAIAIYDNSIINPPMNVLYYPSGAETYSHYARDIVIDKNGNIFVIGYVQLLAPNYDCILLKYNSSLNLVWEKIININIDDKGEGVDVDSAGNIYCAIHSGTGPGNYDCYTVKFDQLGNETWRRQYGTNGVEDQLWDIAVDQKGNVYSVGNSNDNFLIIKYGFYGDEKWVRNFNLGVNDQFRAVIIGKK